MLKSVIWRRRVIITRWRFCNTFRPVDQLSRLFCEYRSNFMDATKDTFITTDNIFLYRSPHTKINHHCCWRPHLVSWFPNHLSTPAWARHIITRWFKSSISRFSVWRYKRTHHKCTQTRTHARTRAYTRARIFQFISINELYTFRKLTGLKLNLIQVSPPPPPPPTLHTFSSSHCE